MPSLPARFAGGILVFAPLFVHGSWRHAQLLLIGAILTPGRAVYAKPKPIFVDARAAVRDALWREQTSMLSRHQHHRPIRRLVLTTPLGLTLFAKPLDRPKST